MSMKYSVILEMIDKMTAPLKSMTTGVKSLSSELAKAAKIQADFDKTLSRSADLTVVGAGAMAVGQRISDALQQPLDVAMEFEATMSKVQALTRLDTNDGAQRAKLDALREQAKFLGDTTSFSASQAADAQSFLAMAGFDPEKIMQSMPGMLSLAKAGGTELARTADIASNVLSGFSMNASEMTRLSDVMAYTFSSSNVNMEMLGDTMKYVAPVASKAGASLEQVAAMSGMLGDVGIQGSMAGTALRAAFIRMADPPKEAAKALKALGVSAKDSRGNMREVTDVMLDLNRSMGSRPNGKKLEYISSIFGAEAAAAMMELVSNAEKLDSRFKEIDSSASSDGGAAYRIAKVMGQNLKGTKDEMLSALEGLYITIGDMLIPAVSDAYVKITGIIRAVQGWITNNKALAQTIMQVVTRVGSAISAIGAGLIAFASFNTALGGLRFGLQHVLLRLSLLRMLGVGAFAGITYALKNWQSVLPAVTRLFPELGAWLQAKLPAAMFRFRAAADTLKQIWSGNEYWGGDRLQQFRNVFAIALGVDPIRKFGDSLGKMQAYLPRLHAAATKAFSGISTWLTSNGAKFREILSVVAVAALTKLSGWLERLAAFASNGGLSQWLNKASGALVTVVESVAQFAAGLWASIKSITTFSLRFVEFIGGWKVLGAIFAGGYLIAAFSGFIQGLAALGGMIAALFTPIGAFIVLIAGLVIGVRYLVLYWDEMSVGGRALGVMLVGLGAAIVGYVAYLKLAAMWTAFQLTPLGAWVAGLSLASVWAGITAAATWVMTAATSAFTAVLAVLTSPITLVIAAIAALAAGAYYLYSNWGQVTAYLSQTTWGQMLLAAINMVLSPVQTFNSAVAYLQGLWSSTKASLAETTWGQMLLTGINMLLAPFDMFKAVIAALTGGWSAAKASLADTSWGQAILAVINSVMAGFEKLKAGFAAAKSMASAGVSMASEKISGAVSWAKSAVGMESSGNRALGGAVEAGKMYRVNEYGDELIERGNKMFLMSSGAGKVIPFPNMPNMRQETPFAAPAGVQTVPQRAADERPAILAVINSVLEKIEKLKAGFAAPSEVMPSSMGKVIPFPNMPNMRQETPFAAPAGVQTVPQRAAAMAANAPSRSEVDVRIISDKPVQVERMRSDRNTALTVDTGRMMTSP